MLLPIHFFCLLPVFSLCTGVPVDEKPIDDNKKLETVDITVPADSPGFHSTGILNQFGHEPSGVSWRGEEGLPGAISSLVLQWLPHGPSSAGGHHGAHHPLFYLLQPPHHHSGSHHGHHSAPPPPEASVQSYVATLYYGPSYPSLVYRCTQPSHHRRYPGASCTVTVHRPGHLQLVEASSGSSSSQDQLSLLSQKVNEQK